MCFWERYLLSPITLRQFLQIAVSMDYAIFLLHSFETGLEKGMDKEKALSYAVGKSLSTILASSLTTVGGFLALCAMSFGIGKDYGNRAGKGCGVQPFNGYFLYAGSFTSNVELCGKD